MEWGERVTIDIGLTDEEKSVLFGGLFRHIERNVETYLFCSEENIETFESGYKKLMKAIFGSTYYEVSE